VEAAWKLGDWESLDLYLAKPHEPRFEASLGDILVDFRRENEAHFLLKLQKTQETLVPQLSAASMESYARCYDFILQLHMLCEIRTAFSLTSHSTIRDKESTVKLNDLLTLWESRLKITAPSLKVREPILTLRRTLLNCSR
jgi:serine/threonine-protein kinase ATR